MVSSEFSRVFSIAARCLLLGISTFFCATLSFAQNWTPKAPINGSVNFKGVYFTNDQTGYAVGTGGFIYKTTDGGLSWSAKTSGTTNDLEDVFFATNLVGYATGANGTILRTANAGNSWSLITGISGISTTTFHEIHFPNNNVGYFVGTGGKIVKTPDGGSTWSVITTGFTNTVKSVFFTTNQIGFVSGAAGFIRKTTDGGATWNTVPSLTTTENINDVFFVDGTLGYVACSGGEVWKTTDTGATWTLEDQGIGSLENEHIFFPSASFGFVTTGSSYNYVTEDGAANWVLNSIDAGATINDLFFSSIYTGYMVCDNGYFVKFQSELEPEYQATGLAFSEVFTTSMRVDFTGSIDLPTGYIAIAKAGSAPAINPEDGSTYSVGQVLGDGSVVVFNGGGTSFSLTSLTANTNYYFNIYAYNGTGQAINYKPSSPLAGSKRTFATGSAWNSIITDTFWYPNDVHFFDANTGGVAGTYALATTLTGGQSFQKDGVSGDDYRGVFYTSATTAYMVGSHGIAHVIRRTVNAGASWVDQLRAVGPGFWDVWFTGPLTGFAVGDDGTIFRTTNGISWSALTSPTSSTLRGLHFPTSSIGYAVGLSGTILKTTDGGANWSLMISPTSDQLNGVYFTDANTGYIIGVNGRIMKTTDGGTIWTSQTSGTTNELLEVHFANSTTGYAVGYSGTILKTSNGGTNWYPLVDGADPNADYWGVHFPTPNTGYAVGNNGTTTAIYKFQSVPEPSAQATALSFSSITQIGLTVTFTAATDSPNGYLVLRKVGSTPTSKPLDGVAYSAGDVIGDATVAYFGSSTSFVETALAPGTSYYYAVYPFNTSGENSSTNFAVSSPLTGNTTTTLVPPVANNASAVASTSFTANWSAVSGATSYRLDVSVDGFSTFVSGYNNLTVAGTSASVTGLTAGTTYSYRVRAVNISGSSYSSNTVTTLSLPAAPTSSAATSITTTGFTANWSASTSATGYFLDVSTNNFVGFVTGYSNVAVPGTSWAITGLTAGTGYQYRVRAANGSGNSSNSGTITTITLCSPPTANAATSVLSTSFTANWSATTGASDYRLDVSTDPSFSFSVGSYNNLTVAGTSQSVTGLNPGTSYYYRVRASNTSGSSANSGPISVLTLPSAPVANEALSVGSTTFTANWNPVSSATGYFIDVSTVVGFSSFVAGYNNTSVSGTSTTVTVPTAGITYYYRVRSVNATGASANSNAITTLLKPATPTANAATAITATGFTANWDVASGATSYSLEVSSDNFVSNVTGYDNLSVTGTAASVTDLSPGVTYKFRLRALNGAGVSATSNSVTVITAPAAPVATSATTFSTAGFTATWTAATGATTYQLDVTANDFTTMVTGFNNLSVSGTSKAITGLTAGTTYQYRLRSVNGSGTSGNSNTVSTVTLPAAPTANNSSAITSTGFTASWSTVTGASDYRIDVSTSNTFSSFAGTYNNLTVSGTSLAVTGLVPGTTYYYRVRASNASGSSTSSSAITTLLKPAAPNATASTSVSVSGFTANWDAIAGVTGYKLDVSLNDFVSNVSGYGDLSVAGTSQAITGLVAGTTYKFRVRALNATGASDNSNTVTTVTVPPAPVTTAATAATTTGFTANWINNGVTAYYLDVSANNFVSNLVGYDNLPLSGTSHAVTGLTAGTTYKYRVRAGNISGTSANSNVTDVTTVTISPTATVASSVLATGFTANWSATAGATDYRVDISTDNLFNTFVGSYFNQQVAGTSLAATALNPGTYYYYRVRGNNASGSSTNSSTITVLTLPDAPVANAGTTVGSTSFVASWNTVPSATGYLMDVSTAADNFSSFVSGYNDKSVSGTSVAVMVPIAGIEYVYRVRAINASGTSANSNITTVLTKPQAPVALSASAITADGFAANWSAVPGALGYYLDVSTNNFASYLTGYENFLLSGVTKTITGLTPGTAYQYRVRAYNTTGSSPNSETIATITIPPAPVTISSSSFTPTSFTANWQPAVGATEYRLDVSNDPLFALGTFVAGFDDRVTTETSTSVTGLTPGTVYYYRVRGVNSSGTSINSNVTSSTNVPGAPVVAAATAVTSAGFVANWSTAPGADTYFLDVSTNNFVTFVSVFNNFSVTGNSYPVSGLNAGTEYQYRLRAANSSGTSVNSLTINVITLPPSPVALSPTNFTTTDFKANWVAAASATGYLLDVSADDFNTFATGFENLSVTSTSTTVSGLVPGTLYHYRVRAINASGESAASTSVEALTISPAPPIASGTSVGVNSFIANWSAAVGAESYAIDVSADGFNSLLSSFSDKQMGTSLSGLITGLLPATTYQYRVRAVNASGISPNSNAASVTTLDTEPTAQPSALVFSDLTTHSMKLSFNPGVNADGYLILRKPLSSINSTPTDGVVYSVGEVLGDATVVMGGTGTSLLQDELLPGTSYFFKLFAYNGNALSTNYLVTSPLEVSQITLPVAPLALLANTITQNSFVANWEEAEGATSYLLDVSTDNFTTTMDGFSALPIENALSYEVSGLAGGTNYQYRVRAVNAAGESANSEPVNTLTIPATPSGLTASVITATSFKLSWNAIKGFDNFLVDLSPDNFVTYTLNGVSIPGPDSFEFLGLSPLTTYKVRLRSSNATGKSSYSEVLTVTTLPSGGATILRIETPVYAGKLLSNPVAMSVEVSGGIEPKVVKLKYRKISQDQFESLVLSLRANATNLYDYSFTPEMADELGIEFLIEASDATGVVKESPTHYFIYKAVEPITNQTVQFASSTFDGRAASYQMFSIPYVLEDANISNLFDPALNGQDPTRWKLLHYQNGAYASYPEQLKKIELGKGYWFNTIEPDFQIKLSQATVSQVSQTDAFEMNLEKGWNQIGNPYPFNIDWQKMKDANASAGLNSIWLFEEGAYVKKDVLATWKGAFVFSDNGGAVSFPLAAKTDAAGRIVRPQRATAALDENDWKFPITLRVGSVTTESTIGMMTDALRSKDSYDEMVLPRFLDYVEMTTLHPEFFAPYFSTDVVTSASEYEWLFQVEANVEGDAQLSWDASSISAHSAGLFLIDITNQVWVDMKSAGRYSFDRKAGHQFKITYSKTGEFNPGMSLLGQSFPNPFRQHVTIPVVVESDNSFVQVEVFDMIGKRIKTLEQTFVKKGFHSLEWDASGEPNPVESGMLLYRMKVNGRSTPVRRMVKVN